MDFFNLRCNFRTLITFNLIVFIGIQAVQSWEISRHNDITFDDSPLGEPENANFVEEHKLSDKEQRAWPQMVKLLINNDIEYEDSDSINRMKRALTTFGRNHRGVKLIYSGSGSGPEADDDDDDDDDDDELVTSTLPYIKLDQFFILKFRAGTFWKQYLEALNAGRYESTVEEINRKLENLYKSNRASSSQNEIHADLIKIDCSFDPLSINMNLTVKIKSNEPIAVRSLEEIIKPILNLHHISPESDGFYQLDAITEDEWNQVCKTLPWTTSVSENCKSIEPSQSTTEIRTIQISTESSTARNTSNKVSKKQRPKIKSFKDLYTAVRGMNFSLACEATASSTSKITWEKMHEDGLGLNVQQFGDFLNIFSVQLENRGVYQCTAEANGRIVKSSTFINVEVREAPMIEIYPLGPQILKVGEFALLSCRVVAGIPWPTLVWVRRDGALLSHRIEEKSVGTILIANITVAEAGDYECQASNIIGETSETTSIIVQSPTMNVSILPNKPEITLIEGDSLELLCMTDSDKPSQVKWYGPKTYGTQVVLSNAQNFTSENYAIYKKFHVNQRHEGIYVCRASNEDGQNQKQIKVLIQQKTENKQIQRRRTHG